MPSEPDLLALAAGAAKRTTISWREYLRRVAEQPGYDYEHAQWFRAGSYLETIKHLPPPPPPDAPAPLAEAQGRIFLADAPLDCLAYPAWFVPVVTADPGYPACQDRSTIDQLHARFGKVEAWADCKADGTPYSAAVALMQRMGLQGAWGQCETQAQFDAAVSSGARRLVGKVDASVLGDSSSARAQLVGNRTVLVTVEQYGYDPPPDWRHLAGVAGSCIATYQSPDDHPEPRTVDGYKQRGYYTPHASSVYAGGSPKPDAGQLA